MIQAFPVLFGGMERPALDLNFAALKQLDPRVTFTRGSSGTFIGADGTVQTAGVNVPRFTHDPVSGASLGLLVEESRTNAFTYSAEFDNAAWSKSAVTANANAAIAPDGTASAEAVLEAATTDAHQMTSTLGTSGSSASRTLSVFAKANGRSWLRLNLNDGTNRQAWFDVANGIIGTTGSGVTAVITAFPNGWFRCAITTTSTHVISVIAVSSADAVLSYAGNASLGLLLWGAQFEVGAFATSYIATAAASATRAADVASMTGADFSSWYRQDEGTVQVDSDAAAIVTNAVLASIDDGTLNNRIEVRHASTGTNTTRSDIVAGGSVIMTSLPLVGAVSRRRAATAYAAAASIGAGNGMLGAPLLGGVMPTGIDRLRIGVATFGGQFNGTIARLRYWRRRLPDSQLQTLTRL